MTPPPEIIPDEPTVTVVVLATDKLGFPHSGVLLESNRGIDVRFFTAKHGPLVDGRDAWKNMDVHLREWWRTHRDTVAPGGVLFLEGDAYCNMSVLELVGGRYDKFLVSRVEHLPSGPITPAAIMSGGASCKCAPMLCYVPATAMDALLSPEYDQLFEADIFCEKRMPSALCCCGYPPEEFGLPGLRWLMLTHWRPFGHPEDYGIFHPVKLSSAP